jgi:hypothetical protein
VAVNFWDVAGLASMSDLRMNAIGDDWSTAAVLAGCVVAGADDMVMRYGGDDVLSVG